MDSWNIYISNNYSVNPGHGFITVAEHQKHFDSHINLIYQ